MTPNRAYLILVMLGLGLVSSACGDATENGARASGAGGHAQTSSSDVGGGDAGGAGPGAGGSAPAGTLAACIDAGGAFKSALSFDNNVSVDHGTVGAMAVAASGEIAIASSDGAVKWWTLEGDATGASAAVYDAAVGAGSPQIQRLAYAPTGSLVTGDAAGTVGLWNPSAFAETATVAASSTIAAVTTDSTHAVFAESVFGGNIEVWTFGSSALGPPLPTSLWGVAALALLADGSLVSAGDNYGQPMVELRAAGDVATVKDSWLGTDLSGDVRAVRATADGKALVAAGDGFVLVLDRASLATPIARVSAADHQAIAVDVSVDEDLLLTAGAEGSIRVWDRATGALRLTEMVPGVVGMAREPNGDGVLVALEDGHVELHRCVAP